MKEANEELGTYLKDHYAGVFQALETLAIGITGKRLLWRALREVRNTHPALQKIDFGALEKRALEQFDRVETARLNIATATFPPS